MDQLEREKIRQVLKGKRILICESNAVADTIGSTLYVNFDVIPHQWYGDIFSVPKILREKVADSAIIHIPETNLELVKKVDATMDDISNLLNNKLLLLTSTYGGIYRSSYRRLKERDIPWLYAGTSELSEKCAVEIARLLSGGKLPSS